MRITGILLCAGSSARMGFPKLITPLCGKTAIERSVEALAAGGVDSLVLVAGADTRAYLSNLQTPVPSIVVDGGETRQASVRNALFAADGDIAVIHDAARCFVAPSVVRACIDSAIRCGSGVAVRTISDTVLRVGEKNTQVLPREEIYLMQTPQAFAYPVIKKAHELFLAPVTDDCTLYLRLGRKPFFVDGGENEKLTTPADWARAAARLSPCGIGFDTHRLAPGRKLILGGVRIPFELGLDGHSDADVLTHAVIDALLGAASLGDIGKLFPPTDPRYQDIDSQLLLTAALRRIRHAGFSPRNIDATVICERPRLADYTDQMCQTLARTCGIPRTCVSVKATTTEGMNDEGRGLCISAQAVASLQ